MVAHSTSGRKPGWALRPRASTSEERAAVRQARLVSVVWAARLARLGHRRSRRVLAGQQHPRSRSLALCGCPSGFSDLCQLPSSGRDGPLGDSGRGRRIQAMAGAAPRASLLGPHRRRGEALLSGAKYPIGPDDFADDAICSGDALLF